MSNANIAALIDSTLSTEDRAYDALLASRPVKLGVAWDAERIAVTLGAKAARRPNAVLARIVAHYASKV